MEHTTQDRASSTSDSEHDARTAADGGLTAAEPGDGMGGGVSIEPATGLLHLHASPRSVES